MRVFHRLEDFGLEVSKQSAVAIGNFDGCHLGHAHLLRGLVDYARSEGLLPTVLTFFPHPVEVLRAGTKLLRLSTTSEKLALLEALGVETVLVAPFNKEVSQLSPAAFFERYLIKTLNAKSVHVGFNFRFGRDRLGDTEALRRLCSEKAIRLSLKEAFFFEGEKVSSSFIRQSIGEGNLSRANALLGRTYSLAGQVTSGDRRGGGLGFPTANLRCPVEKLLPKNGVYATQAVWQKQTFSSVTNVGVRPTFNSDDSPPVVEVHLLDFQSRIYEEFLELKFFDRIRDEVKFSSKDALIAQITKDVSVTKEILSKGNSK